MPSRFCPIYSEPFTRNRNTEHVEGSGLGLSITKGLIELMGGELLVESRERAGTTFRVEMEYRIAPEDNRGILGIKREFQLRPGQTGLQAAACWWQKIMRLMRKSLASCYCYRV